MTKHQIISVILIIASFCIGYIVAEIKEPNAAERPSITKPFEVATNAAQERCVQETSGCNNVRAVSVVETDCSSLAPQNGKGDRCGFWTIRYQATDDMGRLQVFSVIVRYDASIKSVNKDS